MPCSELRYFALIFHALPDLGQACVSVHLCAADTFYCGPSGDMHLAGAGLGEPLPKGASRRGHPRDRDTLCWLTLVDLKVGGCFRLLPVAVDCFCLLLTAVDFFCFSWLLLNSSDCLGHYRPSFDPRSLRPSTRDASACSPACYLARTL